MSDISKQNLSVRIFKATVFAVVAGVLTVGTFVLEGGRREVKEEQVKQVSAFNYAVDNKVGEQGVVRFDNGLLKADAELLKDMNGFEMKSGRFWGNFVLEDDVVIVADRLVVMPDHAQFEASFDKGKLSLAVYSGDVYLGFLAPGVSVTKDLNAYSGVFMNRLLVSRGNKVEVSMSKITEQIRPLLYSKLVKEFKVVQVASEQRKDPWILKNLALDSQLRENLKQRFVSNIIFRGASASESFFASVIQWTRDALTFVPEKHQKIQLRRLFAYLDDAIFYANSGDAERAKEYLNNFDVYIGEMNFASAEDKGFYYYFQEYRDGLAIFEPGDSEYLVEKFLLNRQFLAKDEQQRVVGDFWQDIYEALDQGAAEGREAFDLYYNYLDKYLDVLGGANELYYEQYLAYQSQLVDNLLLKYPAFYQDQYFAVKEALEKRYLDLFSGHEREELTQDLIDTKIDFLKRLRKFFLDGEVEIDVAKKIFSRLVAEIDALMPKNKDEVAVIALFESQLKDVGDFWGYLNSPQYQTRANGATEEERYKNYLSEKDKIWSFVNIREDVLGEKVQKSLTVAEVAEEVKKQLATFSDVSSVEVGEIKDSEDRYVEVRVVIGGYPVQAQYDRVNGLLREVYAYDEEISKGSVKVEALLDVLQEKFADLSEEELKAKDADVSLESTAQRYARVYIAKVLSEEGFVVDMKDVLLVDEDGAVYRVQEVVLAVNEKMVVTFDLDMKGELVRNLFVVNDGEPQLIEGEFSLTELKAFIEADGKIDKGESLVEEVPSVKVPR